MRLNILVVAVCMAVAGLIYLSGAFLYGWPGMGWAMFSFAPITLMVLMSSLTSAAKAHDLRTTTMQMN